jgi:ABC-type transport system involved in multi-copper enzyme maturation permease subunit
MRAIYNIAATTVGEAIRRRVLLVILLIGVLILAIAPGLSVLTARQELTVLKSLTLGIIQITSATIAIVLTVYMIPNEIERRTIYTILSKPVQRWQFLVGKYMGALAALAMMMGLMTVTLLIVFWLMQRDNATPSTMMALAKAPMMFFFQMSLLAAVAIFFSTFVSPIVNFFLSGGTYMVGSMFSSVLETIKGNESLHPIFKALATVIHSLVPNFQMFNIQNPIINSQSEIRGENLHFLNLGVYAVIYITILLIMGILIFDRREV